MPRSAWQASTSPLGRQWFPLFNTDTAHVAYRIALWSQSLYIVIPIVIIIFGHWALILQGMHRHDFCALHYISSFNVGVLLTAQWVPGVGCAITKTNNTILAATFIYSMCFDLVVLILTAVKLTVSNGHRSQLMTMLFRDGLIYFMIAYVTIHFLNTPFIDISNHAASSRTSLQRCSWCST